MPARAAAPVLGVVLLCVVAVLLAAGVGTAVDGGPPGPGPTASLSLSVEAGANEVRLVHRAGDAIDPATLRLRIEVDGEPLARQPPVPFFSAGGFHSGPTGPFNPATAGEWTAGEAGTLRVAGTNEPAIRPGARVTVRVYAEGRTVAEVTATAS